MPVNLCTQTSLVSLALAIPFERQSLHGPQLDFTVPE